MKIGTTGPNGYIGSALVRAGCIPLHFDVVIDKVIPPFCDAIIHCAAKTDVEWCETHTKETFETNVIGTKNIAEVCSNLSIPLFYLSTFQVFSGKATLPYTEKSKPDPVNAYGFSKWEGEIVANAFCKNTIIVRCGKVFSYDKLKDDILVLQEGEKDFPKFFVRSFIHLDHFIEGLLYIVDNYYQMPKVINLASLSALSICDFWLHIADEFEIDPMKVIGRSHDDRTKTLRPLKAGLDISLAKRLGIPIYHTLDGIALLKKESNA